MEVFLSLEDLKITQFNFFVCLLKCIKDVSAAVRRLTGEDFHVLCIVLGNCFWGACLSRGVGPDDLQRFPPTSSVLQFRYLENSIKI